MVLWRHKAVSIKRGQASTWEPSLSSNHEEGDSRVWLHAFSSGKARVLIYSPDTDTYHVGLPLLEKYIHTEVTIQLAPSPPARPYSDSRFLLLNRLHQALHHDLNLAEIEQSTLTAVLQVVFVTIGCDYVSFFARLGKVTFLDTLYQHASFITGTSMQDHGTLTDPDPNKSLLAFYLGAAYLKRQINI